MIPELPMLGAMFLTGLAGSAHCLGMCGAISGAFAFAASSPGVSRALPMALCYNLGRLTGYGLLGLIAALLGSGSVSLMPALATVLRVLAGAVVVLIGLQVGFGWRLLAPIERAGYALWARLAPATRRLLPATSTPRALALGLLWGFLPCGLVYSALLLAATSVRALDGALLMFAFGLGTLPAMLMTGLGIAGFATLLQHRQARLGLGLAIIILGLASVISPAVLLFQTPEHH